MRSLVLAAFALALSAAPASAAVVELEDRSSPEDNSPTIAIVVRAAPGETNRISVTRVAGGIAIADAGAPLTGDCEPSAAGRICRGSNLGAVDVSLGDGNDTLDHDFYGGVDAGVGDDDVQVTRGFFSLVGGDGADRLDATGAMGAVVSYADHSAAVSVTPNGLADDGAAGEGDNLIGSITSIRGGGGNDYLEAGPLATSLFGAGGNDILTGSAERDYLDGGAGDDQLVAGDGSDSLVGGEGADVLSGGGGPDEVAYGGVAPVRLSIGDGPNDGQAGEGDDIRGDVEALSSGSGDDVLVGDAQANRLIGHGGHDVLRGGGGADELVGWGDGDQLDGGSDRDRVSTRRRGVGGLDRALLADREGDVLSCNGAAPFIKADGADRLSKCAPTVSVRRRGPMRRHQRVTLLVRCPVRTAVPCRGRLWVHLAGRRGDARAGRPMISRVVRFGPIEKGQRQRLRVLIRGPLPRGRCVFASAVTRRGGALRSTTTARNLLGCLPR